MDPRLKLCVAFRSAKERSVEATFAGDVKFNGDVLPVCPRSGERGDGSHVAAVARRWFLLHVPPFCVSPSQAITCSWAFRLVLVPRAVAI
ncbi:hypothetical protein FF011L_13040 [Roseimaritima multifibrata]|uniref:Uncharacterized protein n=1 Tax=Roseimaritima multifibrata TaxID=1930274 RepID=A0A517MCQ4_9BACT|nr:hypothetical protein FF011L_13040 [Roseimaritima multifibrata]